MSKVDKQALRELAEKATTGPWITHTDKWGELSVRSNNAEDAAEYVECGVFYEIAERIGGHVRGDGFDDFSEVHANAQLIAAANPATVLALLDEIETLRKDAERYRWLRLGGNDDSELDSWEDVGYVCGVSVCTDYGFQQTLDSESLDEAIDAAMQREKDRGR